MNQLLTFPPGERCQLSAFDPNYKDGESTKKAARKEIRENARRSAELAYRLFAEGKRALLLVLQGMDTAGKDGTIRTVLEGINPQSCQITAFRQPSEEELSHDFLWRIHKAVPRRGYIGIFNRSHYEDVLIARVRGLVPEEVWSQRYDKINTFENLLAEGGVTLVKCYLHISKDEQRARLQARLDNPAKHWKFDKQDIAERKLWNAYQAAYEDALSLCNTRFAPWHIIPSDRKWYRNLTVSRLLRETLERLDPRFPDPQPGLDGITVE